MDKRRDSHAIGATGETFTAAEARHTHVLEKAGKAIPPEGKANAAYQLTIEQLSSHRGWLI